jgi:hypothetical protein
MRVPAKPDDILEIYVDESSQNKHRYLVLGAVVVQLTNSQIINDLIAKARLPELPFNEIKWTKVSTAKLPAYTRVVDVLFDRPDELHFHSLFVDTTKHNHKKFNQGDSEMGFNKEVYQLANKVGRMYDAYYFHLYPDYRDTKSLPEELRLNLNRGAAKRGDERDWPIRRCQFRDSKQIQILQLVDVIVGAIAFQLNGHDKVQDANPAKIVLAKYVMQRAGIADILKGTARTGKFTVWPRLLMK